MKAILQSIKPQYCELIAAGKKTIEVRKTKPNIPTPFKVYIYCTKARTPIRHNGSILMYEDDLALTNRWGQGKRVENPCGALTEEEIILNGKVIGEYVCDSITTDFLISDTCISVEDLEKYSGNKAIYGWHISNLVIYDKPKELSEFRIIVKEYLTKCPFRSRVYNNPNFTNGALLPGAYVCFADTEPDYCRGQCDDAAKPLTRPPQSWCYVEKHFESKN